MSYITTIKLALAVMQEVPKNVLIHEQKVVTQKGYEFAADIYEPRNAKKYQGTILFVHGMNHKGNKDPRIVKLCRAMAWCNFRVVTPTYPLIADCIVDAQSIDEIAETIEVVATNSVLSPKGRIGIFSASFSGLFSLCAAKKPKIAHLVSSFCCLGIAYQAKSTFTNILAEPGDDYYAKFISIKNFLRVMGESNHVLEKGFNALIIDSHECDLALPLFNEYIEHLSDEDSDKLKLKTIAQLVQSKADLGGYYQPHIQKMHELYMADSSPQGLSCYVTLVHSEEDKVLHPIESQLLYEQLQKYHIPSTLLITPLLNHADFRFGVKYVKAIVAFIRALNAFLSHV